MYTVGDGVRRALLSFGGTFGKTKRITSITRLSLWTEGEGSTCVDSFSIQGRSNV